MGFDCETCCKSCCYSTPFTTLAAIMFTAFGLAGFIFSGFYGVSEINKISGLQNGTEVNVMAPIVSVAFIVSIIPLVLVAVTSYCITGYIRDVLFQSAVKCCIRSYCLNITVMVVTFLTIIIWLVISIGLGGVMSFYIQLVLTCPVATSTPEACLTYVDAGFGRYVICGEQLEEICPGAMNIGLAFSIALLFAVLVTIGMIIILVIHAAQFVNGKDNLDYRESNQKDGFFSKNSR